MKVSALGFPPQCVSRFRSRDRSVGLHGDSFFAQAQNLGQRNVSGAVVDKRCEPVAGATVFLKNQKTKAIRSYTSAKDGRFRFAQVNMAEDYDLWAEKDGRKTADQDGQLLGCAQGI